MYHDGAGCKEPTCGCKTTGRFLRGEKSIPWHATPKLKQIIVMLIIISFMLVVAFFKASAPEPINAREMGDELFWAGKHKEAQPYFNKILERDPNNLYALSKKCDILRFLNSYQEALTCYDRALAIHPNSFVLQDGKKDTIKLLAEQVANK